WGAEGGAVGWGVEGGGGAERGPVRRPLSARTSTQARASAAPPRASFLFFATGGPDLTRPVPPVDPVPDPDDHGAVKRSTSAVLAAWLLSISAAAAPAPERPARILFIGNSLTYVHDVPGIVAAFAAAAGMPPPVAPPLVGAA